ncbi:50S ribosomal protein L9 [Candidatus Gottesmanbacteria bacterium RIFCSPLOWO2_01_FULL_48_11]|uniref:Large ribosomal subunit protein bL9 n=2 Tax=Patescibacteria group TaxID=1783273 RepID=A0A1F6ASH5_9BACT|nr:MAG: 50S ribosomal protein L9 [Parcubacteria group bacterium GW2011_GWA2_46_10]KKU56333.1 MAG: 50S ribosomal protein L9 [Parcubacteria group bacterium GW2011_GWA1_47_11]OGG27621.1 MAG: 50S ribosomal protein L9 [Candidatus Gottesmanbacteria bacterium RIFCSPLOWO2_01_FULL_48_11]OGY57004.1 MAG: 50S ribosomal protein L9 [Candidatus Colwellbacteria bacterium GWA2_46_10]
MQILLLEDVKGLGRRGEVKNASNGYARNYLIPKGLAKAATRKESQSVEKQTQEKSAKDTELRKTLEDLRKRTEENPVPVLIEVGKRGEIFHSVKASDIQEAFKLYDPTIAGQGEVEIKKPIKGMGRHTISLNLGGGVRDTFTIEIKPLSI